MDKTISVIIPVYNVENYLRACLDSVLASQYTDLEILCVDDGSTDSSGEILEEYARADSRIKVIHKANGGAASARNRGLDAASGRYIAFVDADDRVHAMYFQVLYDVMREHDADIVLCGYIVSGEEWQNSFDEIPVKTLSREALMSAHETKAYVWARLFRRELIGDLRFDETMRIEDAPFNALLMQASPSARMIYVDLRLFFYTVRADSLSRNTDPEAYYELSAFYGDCARKESDPAMKRIFAEESVKRGLSAALTCYMHRDTQALRRCQALMRKSVGLTGRKRIVYRLFIECPGIFKRFRFRQDPSLRGWKRKRREK